MFPREDSGNQDLKQDLITTENLKEVLSPRSALKLKTLKRTISLWTLESTILIITLS